MHYTKSTRVKPDAVFKKTLDSQHCLRQQEFKRRHERIQSIRTKLEQLDQKLGDATDMTCVQITKALQEKKGLLVELEAVHEDEVEYYMNTGSILYNYYDILENNASSTGFVSNSNEGILKFLVKKAPDVVERDDRATLLNKYMSHTDTNFIKDILLDTDVCMSCSSKNRTIHQSEGMVLCNDCFCVEYIIVDHDRPSYKDPPKEVSYYAYKRINHFNEWINQIQGKESTDIQESVFDMILLEIRKKKITNMANVTIQMVHDILKKLNLIKLYEHQYYVLSKLNGIPTTSFEPELEEKLRTMFKLVQVPFSNNRSPDRKNFLSYAYVISKCLTILGREEFLHLFPLLKNRGKLYLQDCMWKCICHDLSWPFHPSL